MSQLEIGAEQSAATGLCINPWTCARNQRSSGAATPPGRQVATPQSLDLDGCLARFNRSHHSKKRTRSYHRCRSRKFIKWRPALPTELLYLLTRGRLMGVPFIPILFHSSSPGARVARPGDPYVDGPRPARAESVAGDEVGTIGSFAIICPVFRRSHMTATKMVSATRVPNILATSSAIGSLGVSRV